MNEFEIPQYNVDHAQVKEQMVARMVNTHDLPAAQNDRSVAAVVADVSAAGSVYGNIGAMIAEREGFLVTAIRPTSIMVGAKSIGTRPKRNTPAKVEVRLMRDRADTQVVFSPFTQWIVDGQSFFNRHTLSFPQGVFEIGGEYSGVFLYAGEVHVAQINLPPGENFETVELPFGAFTVSDTDVKVYVNQQQWTRLDDALFLYDGRSQVFLDDTSYDGRCQLTFGNGLHGRKPASTDTIMVAYIKCNGKQDNRADSGLDVQCPTDSTISGMTVTPVSHGEDRPSAESYKFSAPQLARIGVLDNAAGTADEHAAVIAQFPNVTDVMVLGQQELIALNKPKYQNPAYMNHVEVLALPRVGLSFADSEKAEVCAFVQRKSRCARQVAMNLVLEPVVVDMEIEIDIFDTGNRETVQAAAESAIRTLFKRSRGLLQRLVSTDDVNATVRKSAGDVVDSIRHKLPLSTTELLPYQFPEIGRLTVEVYYSTRRKKV